MADILYYLLKVSVGTTVFYITYHLLFIKSKQFVFNRIYLAGSFLASFIIPLVTFRKKIHLTETYSYITAEATGITESLTYSPDISSSLGLNQYLLFAYLTGSVLFLSKFIYAFIIAARIRANSTTQQIAGMRVNVSGDNFRAFTFFNRIVIGQKILQHPSLTMILVHEAVHFKEKHFLDILLAELFFILQWFNPFAWLQRRAIRNNLEFRADDVVPRSFNPYEYQLAILSVAQNRIINPIFIQLNSSNLKKRIIMMKSDRHTRFSGITRLAIIPVCAILLLSLSGKETVVIRNTENTVSQIDSPASPTESVTSQVDPDPSQHESSSVSTINILTEEIESVQELRRFIAENIRYPKEAVESGQMGHVGLFASVNSDGTTTEITTSEPSGDYIDINEIVIVGYSRSRDGLSDIETGPIESPDHKILISEGRRVINSLPPLNIPEVKDATSKFNFRFVLQSDGNNETSREIIQSNAIQEGSTAPHKRHKSDGQLLPMAITWPRHSNELVNLDEVKKYLQYYMRYPVSEAEAGKQGSVVIYAKINNEGWVEDASEQKFSANYIDLGEPVIFGGIDNRSAYTSEPGLVREGKNLLLSLPRLDIPELQGKAIKATLLFGLLE